MTKLNKVSRAKVTREMIRQAAEKDLWTFARLVHPERLYGDLHKKCYRFLQKFDSPNALLLLPRGHLKSHMIAVYTAWRITIEPSLTTLYVSATSTLAEAQLYAIKNTMTNDIYRSYWPEMINLEEGQRERWTANEITVDHPKRKAEGVRDVTILAAGLTTNTTGHHADLILSDDVVVPRNAYTEEGRRLVAAAMSQMASILNTGGSIVGVGTRYHTRDQYSLWKDQTFEEYNDEGELTGVKPLWDILEEVVETNGTFIWPRASRDDGKAFGFNMQELARISGMYTDRTQFHAQYYNNPNDPESQRVKDSSFQYYERSFVKMINGSWYYKSKKLNLYTAMDFAYTLGKRSDYTAIIVIGIDNENNIYILDIERFKTDKISEYYDRIVRMHSQWEFRKLRAEITSAQSIIVGDLKDRFRKNGVMISIDTHSPTRHDGRKEERIAAILEPRYDNMSIWHFKGGHTPALEEELVQARPLHDDLKDCLAAVIETAVPPRGRSSELKERNQNVIYNTRFGGVSFR